MLPKAYQLGNITTATLHASKSTTLYYILPGKNQCPQWWRAKVSTGEKRQIVDCEKICDINGTCKSKKIYWLQPSEFPLPARCDNLLLRALRSFQSVTNFHLRPSTQSLSFTKISPVTAGAVPYMCQFSSVQFSRSVVSDSLRPHESQHARPPCPSPTPGVYPNPCPLSR